MLTFMYGLAYYLFVRLLLQCAWDNVLVVYTKDGGVRMLVLV